jgi:invasion protein IalB
MNAVKASIPLALLLAAGCQVSVDNKSKANVENAADSVGATVDKAADAAGKAIDKGAKKVENAADRVSNGVDVHVNLSGDRHDHAKKR